MKRNRNEITYYENGAKERIIAVLYHNNRRLEGVATCGPEDVYNESIGREIAAAKVLTVLDRAKAASHEVKVAEYAKYVAQYQRIVDDNAGKAKSLRAKARKRSTNIVDKYSTPRKWVG